MNTGQNTEGSSYKGVARHWSHSHKEIQVKNIRYKNCPQWSCQETVHRIVFQELCSMWEIVLMPSPASIRT